MSRARPITAPDSTAQVTASGQLVSGSSGALRRLLAGRELPGHGDSPLRQSGGQHGRPGPEHLPGQCTHGPNLLPSDAWFERPSAIPAGPAGSQQGEHPVQDRHQHRTLHPDQAPDQDDGEQPRARSGTPGPRLAQPSQHRTSLTGRGPVRSRGASGGRPGGQVRRQARVYRQRARQGSAAGAESAGDRRPSNLIRVMPAKGVEPSRPWPPPHGGPADAAPLLSTDSGGPDEHPPTRAGATAASRGCPAPHLAALAAGARRRARSSGGRPAPTYASRTPLWPCSPCRGAVRRRSRRRRRRHRGHLAPRLAGRRHRRRERPRRRRRPASSGVMNAAWLAADDRLGWSTRRCRRSWSASGCCRACSAGSSSASRARRSTARRVAGRRGADRRPVGLRARLYGLVEGLGVEVVFALLLYRRFGLVAAMAPAPAAVCASAVLDLTVTTRRLSGRPEGRLRRASRCCPVW